MSANLEGNAMDEWNLATLVERGGVHHNVSGANVREIVFSMTNLLPPLPPHVDMEKLFTEILQREALISTGVGRGIAIPHPRKPMLDENETPLVAVGFPAIPIDWNTQDGSKVHTVFLIISSSVKQHLGTLSKINFLCQQEKFHSLIINRASRDEIVAAIKIAETAWRTGHGET